MICLVSNGLIIEVVSAWRWHFVGVVQYKEELSSFGWGLFVDLTTNSPDYAISKLEKININRMLFLSNF